MKFKKLIFLFFTASGILIFFALLNCAKPLYEEQLILIKELKIQKVCMKHDLRKRKIYVPNRSFTLAQKEIDRILKNHPLLFASNSFLMDKNNTSSMRQTLRKIGAVINHTKEDVILSIETHTDNLGSQQHNLELSQKRADILKNYFIKRVNIPLIVAIGYGEALPLLEKGVDNRRVEINLKRIQQ